MRRPRHGTAVVLLLGSWLGTTAASDVEQSSRTRIAPGTEGVVRTVLEGSRIQEIPVRFLGTYEDLVGPGYDVYLVRLEGPVAERVGVAAGMSGSPVYVDGKIVGALAYRFGVLPKQPIAGVTPIEDMLAASVSGGAPAAAGASTPTPIATPISLGGLVAPVRDWLAPQLEALGFMAVAGGGAAGSAEAAQPLEPGMPVAAELVGGDLRIAAIGTVAYVDGDTVYAFGHPFFATGRVEMRMTTAEVVHTVSDLIGSFKLSNLGAEVGAIVEDRLTAVVGRIGAKARTIPMDVVVKGGAYGERQFHFEIVRHSNLAPLMAGVALANALLGDTGFEDPLTLLGSGSIRIEDLPELPLEMAGSGEGRTNPVLSAASQLQRVLASLYANPFAEPEVQSIELDFRAEPVRRSYSVESLLYDRGPIRPGEELVVRCRLRGYRGQSIGRTFSISVPGDLPPGSTLTLAVGDAAYVDRALGKTYERRIASSRDLGQLVRALGEPRSPHRLIAVLYRSGNGVISDGTVYADLPSTAARLMSETGGRSRAIAAPLFEERHELDGPVAGGLSTRLRLANHSDTETP